MITKTILNFTGLYAVIQLCIITIGEVFNIEMNSGVQIGAMIGFAVAVLLQTLVCLLIFGKVARRYLTKLNPA